MPSDLTPADPAAVAAYLASGQPAAKGALAQQKLDVLVPSQIAASNARVSEANAQSARAQAATDLAKAQAIAEQLKNSRAQWPGKEGDLLTGLASNVGRSSQVADMANRFVALQQKYGTNTGPMYGKVHIPLLGDESIAPIAKQFDHPLQGLDALTQQYFGLVRDPSPGNRLMASEVPGFKLAVPNIATSPDQNVQIRNDNNKMADQIYAKAAYVQAQAAKGVRPSQASADYDHILLSQTRAAPAGAPSGLPPGFVFHGTQLPPPGGDEED